MARCFMGGDDERPHTDDERIEHLSAELAIRLGAVWGFIACESSPRFAGDSGFAGDGESVEIDYVGVVKIWGGGDRIVASPMFGSGHSAEKRAAWNSQIKASLPSQLRALVRFRE
ncbi:MAG: hypothetical protein AAFR38_00405 [Planctomycetota bacterium]